MRRLSDAQTRPVMLASGVDPLTPYPGNKDRPWPCRCLACTNIVTPTYGNIRRGQGACKYCAGNAAISSDDAELLLRSAGFKNLEPYPGRVVAPWICQCLTCGQISRPRLSTIKGGSGCRYCSGNTISVELAIAVMNNAGLRPLVPYKDNRTPWLSVCLTCGSHVTPTFSNIRRRQRGCKPCGLKAMRVDEAVAIAVMRAGGVEPLASYPGGGAHWKCRCIKCGRIVHPRYDNVRAGQGGCRLCKVPGIGPGDAAIVYLILHPLYSALKVGIAAAHGQRIARHRRRGWVLIDEWTGMNGSTAVHAETEVLRAWRSAGIPEGVLSGDMPQGGFSETAPLDLVDLAETRRIVASIVA